MDLFPKRGIRCNTVAPGPVWCAWDLQKPCGVCTTVVGLTGCFSWWAALTPRSNADHSQNEGAADCCGELLALHAPG